MRIGLTGIWALAVLLIPVLAHAQEPKRLALLIANQGYGAEIGSLKNPHNDIRRVGAALAQIGFNIGPPVREATREQILLAVHEFGDRLNAAGPGAIGFLYYSGHGAAVGGENLLLPVNVTGAGSRELEISGVRLTEIIATLNERAPHAAHFVVFDACRNNLGGARGARGFVPLSERPGTLIAFSTSPGNTASDDGRDSGPYAAALAAEIVVPGRNHDDMFFEVRRRVADITRQEQVPWTQDGLLRQIHFGGQGASAPGGAVAQGEAEQVWLLTKDSTDKGVLEAFIAEYKETFYAELARARLREIEQGKLAALAKSAPSSSAPTTNHPFDGTWQSTFTATTKACPFPSGEREFKIAQGKLYRGEQNIASAEANGEVSFIGPGAADPRKRVRHSIKLNGDAGTGTFETIGHPCAGTWAWRRVVGPSTSVSTSPVPARATTEADPGHFDGTWLVTRSNEGCRSPKTEFRLVIAKDWVGGTLRLVEIGGTITPAGVINFSHKNTQPGGPDLRYTGKFDGRGGVGTFTAARGACRGTFTATLE